MEKTKKKKYLAVLLIICIVCVSSVFSADASPKVRSKSITMNAEKATIGIGDILTLNAVMKPTNSTDTIKWSSSNKNVATVNKYGAVTAVGEGSATITAKTSSKKTTKCIVTVKKQLSEAEVSALIAQKCLSEETVRKLIKENTLSEDDVKKIVAENSGGGTGGNSADWEDGTELKMLSGQTLPYSENGVTIEKLTVRKYRYNGEWDGKPQKYKHVIEAEGCLAKDLDLSTYNATFYVLPMSTGSVSSFAYNCPLKNTSSNCISTYSEHEGKFTLTVEHYGIYADYDEYMIYSLDVSRD